jgi:uncharacterized coiled-coil DUF342 family protein
VDKSSTATAKARVKAIDEQIAKLSEAATAITEEIDALTERRAEFFQDMQDLRKQQRDILLQAVKDGQS